MRIRATMSMMGCVVAVAMAAGCAANTEPTPTTSTEAVGQSAQAVKAAKPLEQIWTQVGVNPAGKMELDVMTCADLHQENVSVHPCAYTGDVIQSARIWILDSSFRVKDFVSEHAPSGGCIHVDLASAKAGDHLIVEATVQFAVDTRPDIRFAYLTVK